MGACTHSTVYNNMYMTILRVYKRNSIFMDITQLIENLSQLDLTNALEKYHNKPIERMNVCKDNNKPHV